MTVLSTAFTVGSCKRMRLVGSNHPVAIAGKQCISALERFEEQQDDSEAQPGYFLSPQDEYNRKIDALHSGFGRHAYYQWMRPRSESDQAEYRASRAIERWHAAIKWVLSTHRQQWKDDRHNRMQTAMHRVEARKHEITRFQCKQKKAAMQVMADEKLARERAADRVGVVKCAAEAPGVSTLAKTKGRKMEKLEKHKAALAERKRREAVAAAEQAANADRMAKYLAIGDMINYDKDTRM